MLRIFLVTIALGLASPALAQGAPDIMAAMQAATDRFAGQIVGAELVDGHLEEQAESVFEFRMLTANNDILRIRVDADNLDILEVDGHGLVAARRKPQ